LIIGTLLWGMSAWVAVAVAVEEAMK